MVLGGLSVEETRRMISLAKRAALPISGSSSVTIKTDLARLAFAIGPNGVVGS